MSKRSYPFPYKTVANNLTLDVSLLSIGNITIQSPNTYPTYTLTLPPNDGSPGQILSTDGNGVLSWVNDVSGGTVTSVSATVPAWLSVTVSNPTTTPAIAITGTSTGTGTVTVLQNDPTITTKLTLTRTSNNGEAVRIHNAQASPQKNYIEIGHNSNNHNHAHFGHNYLLSNDAGNYAYMQTGGKELCWDGNSRLFSDSLTLAASFTGTVDVQSSMTVYDNVFTLEGTSSVDFRFRYVRPSTSLVELMGAFGSNWGTDDFFFKAYYGSVSLQTVANQPIKLHNINTGKQVVFDGAADFTFPLTTGSSGQSLITNGLGATSWVDRVSSVSVTVPSFMSVTVTNPNTTPAIAISATSTGTGSVVLATSPTISTPTLNNFATVAALSGQNDAGTLIVRGGTDVYISKYKSGAGGQLNNAFMITTNPANSANTFFYSQGSSVGIFSQAPQETLDVQGSIRASNFIRFNNVNVYPGSSGVLSLYLPTSTGTSGQVLTSTGSGTAMTWTTPTTGTVTSVAATSPLASSGGATPTISIASSTGTGAVALQTAPSFINSVTITHPTQAQLTLLAGTVPSLANISDINLNTIGGGGGTISQYIRAAYDATFGYYISINPNGDFLSNGSRNVFPNNMLIGGTSGTSRLNIGDGAMDSALYGSVQITQTDVTNTKASIAFVRNGHFVHGMGYLTGTSTFGFGAASISSFNPAFLSITSSGTIGIGTTTPAYDLDINKPIGSAISFAVRDGFTAGFRTQWNYSGGQGETVFWDYRGAGSGGFWFKNLNTGNTDAGWAQINCGYTVINNNGETLVLEGTDHTYIRFRYNSINRGFLGYSSANTNGLAIVNTMAGGDIYLYTPNEIISDANHKIVGLLKLGNSLSLGPNPSTSAFTFRFPSSMGTSGQVLTTDGTNTYWGSGGGGGGGGSVNSVTASSPLASSGGTAPNISIASATGTGSVVLNTDPEFQTAMYVKAPTAGQGFMRFISASNFNYIQPGLNNTTGSGAPLLFTDVNAANEWMRITSTGVGIGGIAPNYKLHVSGDVFCKAQFFLEESSSNGLIKLTSSGGLNYIQSGVTSSTGSAAPLLFTTMNSGAELMRITAAGDVGIGTSTPSTKLQVNGTTRSTNFTTNGTNTFTYASGTFTPRIAMFYTSDGKVYECNSAPPGKDNITITYSVQTGVWVRVGNLVTVNMEIQYSQTYAGITFDMTNLNIVAVIPEAACNPSALGAVGVTGYPSRIADRFVDNFQMNYWISNTSYAPGGTICEVQLRRDNTHNMLPWDPTNKSGQRLNITTSYYVNQ